MGAANPIEAMPDYLLTMGGTFLGEEGLQGAALVDRVYRVSGEEKKNIIKEIDRLIAFHQEHTLKELEETITPFRL